MATIQSPMQRCNAVLRAFGARYRLREHRRSPWITVYQLGKGGTTREHTVKGYAAADPEAIESLQDLLIEATRSGKPAVVAFQRGQGVNMNLVGPFKGKGYFCLLPADRAATEADVQRFALHSSESLKARLEDPAAPLIPMATHRQGFRQKREVVSLLRRARACRLRTG